MDNFRIEPYVKTIKQGCFALILGIIGLVLITVFIFIPFNQPEQAWLKTTLLFGGLISLLSAILTSYFIKKKVQLLMDSGGVELPKHRISHKHLSPKLRTLIQEIVTTTGKKVYLYDNRKEEEVSKSEQMPNLGMPPFYMPPNFSGGIRIYIMHHWLPNKDEEATIAKMLMQARLGFDGFPYVRFSLPDMIVQSDPKLSDANAIQRWLHNGLLGLVAEKKIHEKGFKRDSILEEGIVILEKEKPYELATPWATKAFHAIQLALIIMQIEEGILSEELNKRIRQLQVTFDQTFPGVEDDIKKILNIYNQHNINEPNGFTQSLQDILQLWDLDRYSVIGYLDPRSGRIQ